MGLPVADDMAGGPLPIAAPGGPLDRSPLRVASHGAALVTTQTGVDREKLEAEADYLRSLGYVVD